MVYYKTIIGFILIIGTNNMYKVRDIWCHIQTPTVIFLCMSKICSSCHTEAFVHFFVFSLGGGCVCCVFSVCFCVFCEWWCICEFSLCFIMAHFMELEAAGGGKEDRELEEAEEEEFQEEESEKEEEKEEEEEEEKEKKGKKKGEKVGGKEGGKGGKEAVRSAGGESDQYVQHIDPDEGKKEEEGETEGKKEENEKEEKEKEEKGKEEKEKEEEEGILEVEVVKPKGGRHFKLSNCVVRPHPKSERLEIPINPIEDKSVFTVRLKDLPENLRYLQDEEVPVAFHPCQFSAPLVSFVFFLISTSICLTYGCGDQYVRHIDTEIKKKKNCFD